MSTQQIEIVYFAGCPNVALASERTREAIRIAGVPAHVSLVEIKDADDAVTRRFLGSPSIRVDGIDVEPAARERDDFGLQCRVYAVGDRLEGAPPAAWIAAVLEGGMPEDAARQSQPAHGCCTPRSPESDTACAPELVAAMLVEPLRAVFPADTAPIFVSLVRRLAQGTPVSHADVAQEARRSQLEVDQALAKVPSIEYLDGKIVGAALTLNETGHAFEVDGTRLYTWCALDALVLPTVLGKTCRVLSRCPVTRESIELEITPDRVVDVFPAAATVSAALPSPCGDLRESFCDRVRLFASSAAAQQWSSEHGEGIAILSVDEAFRLGRSVAVQLGWAAEATEPLVCTLTSRDQSARLSEFRDAFAYLERTERHGDALRWYFRAEPGLEARLRNLARREQECCRFFDFAIVHEGSSIVWHARAAKHALAVLEEFMRLPETLKSAPNVESMKRALVGAGLALALKPPESLS